LRKSVWLMRTCAAGRPPAADVSVMRAVDSMRINKNSDAKFAPQSVSIPKAYHANMER
jgi:hypothetical protein